MSVCSTGACARCRVQAQHLRHSIRNRIIPIAMQYRLQNTAKQLYVVLQTAIPY